MSISTEIFDYDSNIGRFSAFASNLPREIKLETLYVQGKYREGISLINPKTGNIVKFFLADTFVDAEDEVNSWLYVAVDGSPKTKNGNQLSIKIWND